MSKYTNARYPDKINDLVDNDGNVNIPGGETPFEWNTTLDKELPMTESTFYLVLNDEDWATIANTQPIKVKAHVSVDGEIETIDLVYSKLITAGVQYAGHIEGMVCYIDMGYDFNVQKVTAFFNISSGDEPQPEPEPTPTTSGLYKHHIYLNSAEVNGEDGFIITDFFSSEGYPAYDIVIINNDPNTYDFRTTREDGEGTKIGYQYLINYVANSLNCYFVDEYNQTMGSICAQQMNGHEGLLINDFGLLTVKNFAEEGYTPMCYFERLPYERVDVIDVNQNQKSFFTLSETPSLHYIPILTVSQVQTLDSNAWPVIEPITWEEWETFQADYSTNDNSGGE